MVVIITITYYYYVIIDSPYTEILNGNIIDGWDIQVWLSVRRVRHLNCPVFPHFKSISK